MGLKVLVQNGFTPKNNICCKLVIPTLTCSKTKAATKRKTQGTRSKTLPNINWCWNWIAILWQNICHIWSCHVFFREPICSNTPSWIQSMHDVQMPKLNWHQWLGFTSWSWGCFLFTLFWFYHIIPPSFAICCHMWFGVMFMYFLFFDINFVVTSQSWYQTHITEKDPYEVCFSNPLTRVNVC